MLKDLFRYGSICSNIPKKNERKVWLHRQFLGIIC